MQIGMIGLGKMGMAMGERLVRSNHEVLGFDAFPAKREEAEQRGIKWQESVESLASSLSKPAVIWLMVPAGGPVDETIAAVTPVLAKGDIVIDGGNSYYIDSIRRAYDLGEHGINFIDCGVSGGVWGLKEGFCLMAGGDEVPIRYIEPILEALAPEGGYLRVGEHGAGHFTKMVHNGIEYGMLQAYGEGFELLRASQYDLDLPAIANLWNHGSVVRSWLLELSQLALQIDPDLKDIAGYVEDSGEGRWTVYEAIDKSVPAPIITLSLMARFASRQDESFSAKFIAALRHQFGGHAVREEVKDVAPSGK